MCAIMCEHCYFSVCLISYADKLGLAERHGCPKNFVGWQKAQSRRSPAMVTAAPVSLSWETCLFPAQPTQNLISRWVFIARLFRQV